MVLFILFVRSLLMVVFGVNLTTFLFLAVSLCMVWVACG